MGDYYTNVIPIDVEPADAQAVAAKVVEFMIGQKIIQPEVSDCTLTRQGGHRPAENYAVALDEPNPNILELATNGVEVVVQRSAFDSGGLENIQCPVCSQSVMDTDWGQALQYHLAHQPNNQLTCPACGYNAQITTYIFEPSFVFGELGFTFWNWGLNLNDNFLQQLEQITDSRIAVTFGKL
jgi:hypothetical protein